MPGLLPGIADELPEGETDGAIDGGIDPVEEAAALLAAEEPPPVVALEQAARAATPTTTRQAVVTSERLRIYIQSQAKALSIAHATGDARAGHARGGCSRWRVLPLAGSMPTRLACMSRWVLMHDGVGTRSDGHLARTWPSDHKRPSIGLHGQTVGADD